MCLELAQDLSVDVSPERFFTRCVKCNGRVCPLAETDKDCSALKVLLCGRPFASTLNSRNRACTLFVWHIDKQWR